MFLYALIMQTLCLCCFSIRHISIYIIVFSKGISVESACLSTFRIKCQACKRRSQGLGFRGINRSRTQAASDRGGVQGHRRRSGLSLQTSRTLSLNTECAPNYSNELTPRRSRINHEFRGSSLVTEWETPRECCRTAEHLSPRRTNS